MTFLKKLGQILLQATEIVTGFSGLAQQFMPGSSGVMQVISKDLAAIAQIVAEVEAIGQAMNLAGPQKLSAASPLVAQIILQSSLLVNHKIADEVLFKKACSELAGGMADLLNSLKDNIDTTSKT